LEGFEREAGSPFVKDIDQSRSIAGKLRSEGLELSAMPAWRILNATGFRKTKPARKPELTKKMK
jgi:hypothetical protein